MNKIPYLRICVTEVCGYKCFYCRPGGEACRVVNNKEMSLRQITSLVSLLAKQGVSSLKITGGEPLSRNDIPKMIGSLSSIDGIEKIEMVTRSPKAGGLAWELKENGLSCLNFSLDSLDPFTFYKITRNGRVDQLLEAIRQSAESGIKLKFNMVVMRGINDHEIPEMIEFAGKYNGILKLLDLMNMPQESKFLSQYYMPLHEVADQLSKEAVKKEIEKPPGGIGTPMPKFIMNNGATVLIKDAREGTWYGNTCTECKYYPCQDALMALRLTSDGNLQRCLLRDDNLVDLLSLVENISSSELINKTICDVLETYKNAVFNKNGWKV